MQEVEGKADAELSVFPDARDDTKLVIVLEIGFELEELRILELKATEVDV